MLKFLKHGNNQQDESEKAKRYKLSQEEVKKRNQEYEQTKRKQLFKEVWKQNALG